MKLFSSVCNTYKMLELHWAYVRATSSSLVLLSGLITGVSEVQHHRDYSTDHETEIEGREEEGRGGDITIPRQAT